MVKFGKEFRKYQVTQWKDSYINYKLLKQEIKTIRYNIDNSNPKSRRSENTTISADLGHPSLKGMELIPEDSIIIEVKDLHSLYNLRFGNELKRFVDLLEKEFRKSYIHFVSQEKELYKKVNGHCYSIEVYKDYNIFNIFNEIKELTLTMKLAKQLNCFINDNVMALKKILKKFDKKFHKYFGIIAPKYILTHLTSQNSDLEYLLQFKLIDESTTICENNLNILLNIYKNLKGKNININVPGNDNNENKENNVNLTSINLTNIDNKINISKNRIRDYLDRIDELTYFKIQYREWFYYAKQKDRLVKNNPKIFENDIYNPVLSSTYHKDSLLEKCISSKNALKEVERSQSPLSHSNKTNLIFIYIHSFIYGTMLTNILPVISNYFNTKIISENRGLFLIPLILTYLSYLLPYTIYIYVDYVDKNNFFMNISYIISYILLLLSSFLLFFTNNKSNSTIDFIVILISRILVGFANNQMMNKKYITLYLPKFRLSSVSKKYLIYELLGLIIGPIITLLLITKSEFEIGVIKYTHFNCIGWYGFFVSIFFGFLHFIFFIKPLSSDFIMVKDESNINGSNYYQRSESEINRKQYMKEQKLMYKKTYNTMKKKQRDSKSNNENENHDEGNLIIRNITINETKENEKENNNNIIKTNNDLEENLLNNEDENDKNNISNDSNNEENNSLDVSTGGNIALNAKQQNMINEIEKVLEKRNEACNFNDMNQIPKSINSIINKEKKSFGYINQNLYLLVFMFFICSLIKSNVILHFIYYIQEKLDNNKNQINCLFIFLLGFFQLMKIFFIFPFYQVNYKYRIFMIFSLTSLVVFSASLLINELYGNVYIFIIINILLVLACNIIEICCSCYLSFILSPEWKIFGRNAGHWINFIITGGKIGGGLLCMSLYDEEYVTIWVLFGITSTFFICFLLLVFFTRTIKIKGLTRVIRKSAFEINLDN